mmetsp:Transcript_24991/g.42475  ORF Transcript_24991/g.42475 Transcript_24991/m.42475 type:complete len:91 (-) Transcript_24991:1304-1576(-)|eukprot:scaffold7670_cov120-Skeletonema_marinoi.AAC.5
MSNADANFLILYLQHGANTTCNTMVLKSLLVLNAGRQETNLRAEKSSNESNHNEHKIQRIETPTKETTRVNQKRARQPKHEEDEAIVGTH